MAEQFVLKGVKELRDYSYGGGSPLIQVKNDPRGGSTWQIPKWWDKKAKNTQYVSCTILDIIGTNYLMVIPTSMDTQLMVTYDDDVYNIGFSNFNSVDRIAVYGKDIKKLVVEYLLPSISGGAIAKRILQAPATIGAFTITGPGSAETGESKQYKSNATPSASDAVYAWAVEESGSPASTAEAEITAGATSTGCTVLFKQAGDYGVKCTITSSTASDSPQSDTRSVSCTEAKTVGTATVSGDTTPVAGTPSTYSVSLAGSNVDDFEYAWSVLDGDATVANPTGASTAVTFDKDGNYTVQCIVDSPTASDTSSDQLEVVASVARTIGSVSVTPGSATATAGSPVEMSCTFDGNVLDATYAWSVTPATGVTIVDASLAATNFTFTNTGSYDITCVVSSSTGNDSPQTGSLKSFDVA